MDSTRNNSRFNLSEKHLFNGIINLDKDIIWREAELKRLGKKYPGDSLPTADHAKYKSEKQIIKEEFDRRWLASLDYLRNCCKKIRQTQPHLDKLEEKHINSGEEFPSQIVFGALNLSFENFNDSIPRLVGFPIAQAIWFTGESPDLTLVYQLLLRLLYALPVGRLELYAADPLKGGKSPGPFLPLFSRKNLVPHCRILTRSDEIEDMLRSQLDYIENLRQKRFMDDITDWRLYNQKNNENLLPYRIILLFDIPEQLTDKSLWFLTRLIELGPDCGVLTILSGNIDVIEKNNKYAVLFKNIQSHTKKVDALFSENDLKRQLHHISVVEKEEHNPPLPLLQKYIEAISEAYKKAADFNKSLNDLFPDDLFWKANAAEGLSVPIGWDNLWEEVCFTIGESGSAHHTLVAGQTGSGKSNLIHVIIHSLCHYYSPEELQIFLLDYKQGTESQVYINPPLPHAALIALESDPEYGSAVFGYLVNEMEKRARLFKEAGSNGGGSKDYCQYREEGNKLPRILLMVDEFQGLFSGSKSTGEKTEKCLYSLLRQGRSFGIHIMLSTQALTGIQDILSSRQLTSQIGCRIALACSIDDSGRILGNNGAAGLDISRHEAIINTSNGSVEGNRIFRAPFADKNRCKKHSLQFENEAKKRGYMNRSKIFNGTLLPQMPDARSFLLRECEESEIYPMMIGESLTYEADNFIIYFHKSAASNLLIAGADQIIHDGLLLSIICSSLALNRKAKEEDKIKISYLWGKPGKKAPAFIHNHPEINIVPNTEELRLEAVKEYIGQGKEIKQLLIIDGLESIRAFHLETKPSDFDIKKNPDLPAYLLRNILESGPPLGAVVIAFSENWNYCSQVCPALLKSFEQRIGFSLGEGDAGKLLSGAGSDKLSFRGIENGKNCAVYMDRLFNRQEMFRPYAIQTPIRNKNE